MQPVLRNCCQLGGAKDLASRAKRMHSCRPMRVRKGSVPEGVPMNSPSVALPAPPGVPTAWFSRSAPVGAGLAGRTMCLAATCGEVSGSDAGFLASRFGFGGVASTAASGAGSASSAAVAEASGKRPTVSVLTPSVLRSGREVTWPVLHR